MNLVWAQMGKSLWSITAAVPLTPATVNIFSRVNPVQETGAQALVGEWCVILNRNQASLMTPYTTFMMADSTFGGYDCGIIQRGEVVATSLALLANRVLTFSAPKFVSSLGCRTRQMPRPLPLRKVQKQCRIPLLPSMESTAAFLPTFEPSNRTCHQIEPLLTSSS